MKRTLEPLLLSVTNAASTGTGGCFSLRKVKFEHLVDVFEQPSGVFICSCHFIEVWSSRIDAYVRVY